MKKQHLHVWKTLYKAGLTDEPKTIIQTENSPWYIKTLLAFSGWFAAIFLLIFIFLLIEDILNNKDLKLIIGCLLVIVAGVVLYFFSNDFFENLALAGSLAGQALLTWSLSETMQTMDFWFVIFIFQAILAILVSNFTHRVLSAFFSAGAFYMTLNEYGSQYSFNAIILLSLSYLWLNEFRFAKHIRSIQAVGYGLVLSLISFNSNVIFFSNNLLLDSSNGINQMKLLLWTGEILTSAVLIYIIWQILQNNQSSISRKILISSFVGASILGLVSLETPGITIGISILLIGFSISNRILMSLGIVALILYTSAYYYSLEATLLSKALTLFILGLSLITISYLLKIIFPKNKLEDEEQLDAT